MVSNFFKLSKEKIEIELEKERLFDDRAGAISTFEGRVRNHNDGMKVTHLIYEAYESLTIKLADTIIREAKTRFSIIEARAVHRTGQLEIGEVAVWIGVSSAHRKEAFTACHYIIDEIKHRLPIWKNEFYTDGSNKWVNCQSCASHTRSKSEKELSIDLNSRGTEFTKSEKNKVRSQLVNSKGGAP